MADFAPDVITVADGIPPPLPPPAAGPDSTSPAITHHNPSVKYLPSWLLLSINKTDDTLSHLSRVFKTSSGTDASLQLLSYSLTLITSILSASSQQESQLASLAATRIQKTGNLSPSVRAHAAGARTRGIPLTKTSPSRLSVLDTRLRAFNTLLGDVRIFLRLWGLISIYAWASGLWKTPPKDGILRGVAWLQVCATTGFQILENGAYLSKHGVLGLSKKNQGAWWIWSARMWAAHVALDFGRLWRVSHLAEARRRNAASGLVEKGDKLVEAKEKEDWWRAFVTNAAFAPLLVHYSMEKGTLDQSTIGACGTVAGILGFREAWNKSAT